MRLRTLTEEECYARCYGGRRDDAVNVLFDDVASEGPVGGAPLAESLDPLTVATREEREAA